MSCKKCGMCCRVIPLVIGRWDLLKLMLVGNKSALFVLRYWRRISWEEVKRIVPEMNEKWKGSKWCRCKLVSRNGECRKYEKRPVVCWGYPYYGKEGWETSFEPI